MSIQETKEIMMPIAMLFQAIGLLVHVKNFIKPFNEFLTFSAPVYVPISILILFFMIRCSSIPTEVINFFSF